MTSAVNSSLQQRASKIGAPGGLRIVNALALHNSVDTIWESAHVSHMGRFSYTIIYHIARPQLLTSAEAVPSVVTCSQETCLLTCQLVKAALPDLPALSQREGRRGRMAHRAQQHHMKPSLACADAHLCVSSLGCWSVRKPGCITSLSPHFCLLIGRHNTQISLQPVAEPITAAELIIALSFGAILRQQLMRGAESAKKATPPWRSAFHNLVSKGHGAVCAGCTPYCSS